MAKADDEGIPFEDYIKVKPESFVRTMLDCGQLRYTWVDANDNARASDDGGSQPPKGWWGMVETTKFDRERHSVKGLAFLEPAFPEMFFVRVFPAVTVADTPAKSNPLSVKDWLFAEVAGRKLAGDIPTGRKAATLFAGQLADQMAKDAQAGKCQKAISAPSIRVRLYDNKLWPPK